MVDAQSFLDNLENARLAMSVALELTQENRDQFVKNGTGEQVRQAERSISRSEALLSNWKRNSASYRTSSKARSSPGTPT